MKNVNTICCLFLFFNLVLMDYACASPYEKTKKKCYTKKIQKECNKLNKEDMITGIKKYNIHILVPVFDFVEFASISINKLKLVEYINHVFESNNKIIKNKSKPSSIKMTSFSNFTSLSNLDFAKRKVLLIIEYLYEIQSLERKLIEINPKLKKELWTKKLKISEGIKGLKQKMQSLSNKNNNDEMNIIKKDINLRISQLVLIKKRTSTMLLNEDINIKIKERIMMINKRYQPQLKGIGIRIRGNEGIFDFINLNPLDKISSVRMNLKSYKIISK